MSQSDTTDSTDAPLPIDIDSDEDVHEDAVAFGEVLYGVATTLEIIMDDPDAAEEIGWTQENVDPFQEAFETGESVLEHDAYDTFEQEGWSALPDDLVADVFETIAPLAHIYDVEMDAPTDVFLEQLVQQTRRRYGRGS